MFGGTLGSISNQADWSDAIQINDDAGDLVDLTGAVTTLNLASSDPGFGSSYGWTNLVPCLTGSTATGEITYPALGIIEWDFPASSLASLCPGQYRAGIIITKDSQTLQLFLGTVTIEQGL